MVGSHHMLFEGNLSFNYDSDDTWGNALAMTVFRNHLTGRRRDFPNRDNVRAAGLMFGSWWHTFAGNVLGEAWTHGRLDLRGPGRRHVRARVEQMGEAFTIWKLGYAPGAWGQAPDPKVRSTVVREGNFDYVTNSVRWDHEPQSPAELALSDRETGVLRRPALAVGGPDWDDQGLDASGAGEIQQHGAVGREGVPRHRCRSATSRWRTGRPDRFTPCPTWARVRPSGCGGLRRDRSSVRRGNLRPHRQVLAPVAAAEPARQRAPAPGRQW